MDFSIPLQPITRPQVNFLAYRGKPVLLFYFGPTCPHCQAATPEIQTFAGEIRAKGVETLAIANMRSDFQEIGEFITKYGVKIPVYWDTVRKFGETYQVTSLPTLFLVGKNGEVYRLENYSGHASLDSLRARI
ncbi:MAG: TlpA disulfide reductase family protein [Fibrobacteria bacterium]